MSLRDLIAADVTAVFLNVNDFGEIVKRWPAGKSGAETSVTAVWEPDEDGSRIADTDMEQTAYSGWLWLSEDTPVHKDDVWVIGGEQYATQANGDISDGMRRVTVKRVDKAATSKHRGGFF